MSEGPSAILAYGDPSAAYEFSFTPTQGLTDGLGAPVLHSFDHGLCDSPVFRDELINKCMGEHLNYYLAEGLDAYGSPTEDEAFEKEGKENWMGTSGGEKHVVARRGIGVEILNLPEKSRGATVPLVAAVPCGERLFRVNNWVLDGLQVGSEGLAANPFVNRPVRCEIISDNE
ncbi:hypothetical protein K438DRAFT_1782917 [Mycena galopus ATCC 62051]|nr:hypothetical protein K438DRAFT_1782917 [Mycena galopus ATCC 62051]